MAQPDLIIISQFDVVDYERYSRLPLDRLELYHELVFPRMVHCQGRFRSHLDVMNVLADGKGFMEAEYTERRRMLNIWNLPGFAAMHLANYLLQYGICTAIINNIDAEWDRFCDVYGSSQTPPLVGISTTFCLSYAPLQRVVEKLRRLDSDMEIVLGGAFAHEQATNTKTAAFERPMTKHKIDYVLHAFNSEADLRDLVLSRKVGGIVSGVHNLAYRTGEGRFRTNPCRWNDPVLDEVSPCWDRLDLPHVNRTVQFRTSCGCPFACAFCSYPQTARRFDVLGIERTEEHIASLLRIPGVDRIVFIDDTFNVPPERFKELCRMFCKYDFEWFSFLRVQFIDDETARLMRQSGCKAVYLGIESANDTVLKNMNKKATRSDFARGVRLLKKYDITIMAAFVIGFCGETGQSIADNVEFIENEGVDFYTLKEFYYMPHTPIHKNRRRFGLSGMHSDWKHDTMDFQRAHQHKIEMFRQITNSVFVDPDANLWHLAYLYDQGYEMEQIARIQRRINAVMADQMNGTVDDAHPAFGQLTDMLHRQMVTT